MIERPLHSKEEDPQSGVKRISRRLFLCLSGGAFVAGVVAEVRNQIEKNPFLVTMLKPPSLPQTTNAEIILSADYNEELRALVEKGVKIASDEYFYMEPSQLLTKIEFLCEEIGVNIKHLIPVFAYWAVNKETWRKQIQDSIVNATQFALNSSGVLADTTPHGLGRREFLRNMLSPYFAEKVDVVPTVGFYDKEPLLYALAWLNGADRGIIDSLISCGMLSGKDAQLMNQLCLQVISSERMAHSANALEQTEKVKIYQKTCRNLAIYINTLTRDHKNREFDLSIFGLYIKYLQEIIMTTFKQYLAHPSDAQIVYLMLVGSDSRYFPTETLEKKVIGVNSFTIPQEQIPHLVKRAHAEWGLSQATPEKLDTLFFNPGKLPTDYCIWSQL